MEAYDDPLSAFGSRRQLSSGTGTTWTFCPPDPRLFGYEMLVASSDNAAVEIVSKDKASAGGRDTIQLLRPAANSSLPDPATGSACRLVELPRHLVRLVAGNESRGPER